jgi:acetate kinase
MTQLISQLEVQHLRKTAVFSNEACVLHANRIQRLQLARFVELFRSSSFAVALFCYQVTKWIGAFAAALRGLETLVFAGGIGENASAVRTRICAGLGFLGFELEEKRNLANDGVMSTVASRVAVRINHTDEERIIAKTVRGVLGLG